MLKLLIDIELGFFCSTQGIFTVFVKQEPQTCLRGVRHFEGEDVVRCGARQQKVQRFRICQRGFRSMCLGNWSALLPERRWPRPARSRVPAGGLGAAGAVA